MFKTKYGLYEPGVMFFGLTNSPATFQAMMDHLLQPWVDKWEQEGVVGSWYMDDILITSHNKKDHQQATHELLEIFALNGLYFKPEKCVWEQPSVDYLGLILEEGVTCMDPAKVAGHCKLANSKNCQTSLIIPGILQLLPTFHIPIFTHSKTTE